MLIWVNFFVAFKIKDNKLRINLSLHQLKRMLRFISLI
jgi:hypothetical protein